MRPKYFFAGLFVLCFLSNTVKAQERLLVDPAKVDSVQKLIDPHPKEDKEKVMLLNEYARLCFYNQEYKKGLIATRDARELSQKMEFEGGLIMYHITLSIFTDGTLDGPFDFDDYQLSEAKIRAFKIGGDTVLARKPVYPNGYPYEASKEMLERLQPSLEYFRALDDKEIQAAILVHYANYYYLNNHLDKFDSLMGQFVALYQKLNRIDPVLLGYTAKLYAAQLLKNKTGVESIIQEITNLVSQNKDLTHSGNFQLSQIYFNLKQYVLAIGYLNKSADFFEEVGDFNGLTRAYQEMLRVYRVLGMHSYRADLFERFLPIIKKSGNTNATWLYQDAAWANYNSENYNKAWQYLNYIVDSLPLNDFESRFMKTQKVQLKGQILMDQEKYKEAIPLLYEAYNNYNSNIYQDKATGPWALAHIANCYYQIKEYQSALHYANLCFNTALPADLRLGLKINLQLADIYEALGKEDSAYKYLRKYRVLLEESNNLQNADQILEMQINSVVNKSNEKISRLNQESQLKEQRNKNQRLLIFSIAGALFSAVLILFILYRNNKSKQKANTALEQTLSNLKSAQSQLIQSEKMASLGELTAGIAHEIQNPLNFVNNFSEVNKELLSEMKEEIEKGNLEEAKSLAGNVIDNQEKINEHGKRADAIVKNMLQHSRSSSGIKEATNVNTLADEYLKLAYHGFRAKDNTFNVKLNTSFGEGICTVNVIPQDIGRVILNILNNAFYAVSAKASDYANASSDKSATENGEYEPTVFVTTEKSGNNVLILVKDNGSGIPEKVRDKIFQPFFTTKPTGQGTGLGLSLSYDIIKAHGGDLKVETVEGEFTEFTVTLPKT